MSQGSIGVVGNDDVSDEFDQQVCVARSSCHHKSVPHAKICLATAAENLHVLVCMAIIGNVNRPLFLQIEINHTVLLANVVARSSASCHKISQKLIGIVFV